MKRMTIGKRIFAGYMAPLLATLMLILVAVNAIRDVGEAKDEVLTRGARLVVDAHRLDAAVTREALDNRSYLLSGDEAFLAALRADQQATAEVLQELEERMYTDVGRQTLAEARAAIAEWEAAATEVRQAADGDPGELAQLIRDRLDPALREVQQQADELIEWEESLIAEATAASDAAARRATRRVWALGIIAALLAIGLGMWVVVRVRRSLTALALTVDAASSEILAGTSQQVSGSSQQAAAVQETVATVDELVQTAEQSAERARTVADRAQRAAEVAQNGMQAVSDSADGMSAIRRQVDATAQTVLSLAERAQAISAIVEAVDDIAGQTHLLALNAAIEAARAGDEGRGFSVVAGEVRSLADQSRRATGEVTQILGEIQQGTNTAVMATEEGSKRVVEGSSRVEQAGGTIRELADNVAAAALAGEQIAAASTQQAIVTAQISEAMRNIDDVMEHNAASAQQAEQAARDLSRVALELKQLVGARDGART